MFHFVSFLLSVAILIFLCLMLQKNSVSVQSVYNLVLYAHRLFENPSFSTPMMTADIADSGFQTIILWTLHVMDNANLYYNDDCIVSNGKLNASFYGPQAIDIQSKIRRCRHLFLLPMWVPGSNVWTTSTLKMADSWSVGEIYSVMQEGLSTGTVLIPMKLEWAMDLDLLYLGSVVMLMVFFTISTNMEQVLFVEDSCGDSQILP